jgi:hypothetical protein
MQRPAIFSGLIAVLLALLSTSDCNRVKVQLLVFDGVQSEHKWALKDLNPDLPADWSPYNYLVIEIKASTPQRFFLFVYNTDGARRIIIQPFGQNVWLRAAIPLKFFQGADRSGQSMASVFNRPANSFWMSVWGPFGPINAVEAVGIRMEYPLGKPTLEIRSVRLTKEDPGSEILEQKPVVDEFGQWIHADWPRKIKSMEQLRSEWDSEERTLAPGAFNYCQYGGYRGTKAKATGFFRVERVNGKWWLVDPDGHLFLSTVVPNMGGAGAETKTDGREKYYAALPPLGLLPPAPAGASGVASTAGLRSFFAWNLFRRYGPDWRAKAAQMELRRAGAWGLTTVASTRPADMPPPSTLKKPYLARLNALLTGGPPLISYLGMPDIYSPAFARRIDEAAAAQCAPRRDDPYLIGYFIGNEPPWPGRESELVDMFLAGPRTDTQREIQTFLARGDSRERRKEFVVAMFGKYLAMVGAALKKHDPHHMNLGIRFGGEPPDYLISAARTFDVYSANLYTYEPVAQMNKAYEIAGRPIIIGEFHFGVPADGLGAGLVQVRDQNERGVAYRYYVEQAAAHSAFVGAGWYIGVDESATGRNDGENYNIGFLDVTDRPYKELVGAAIETHKRLFDVHSGTLPPFDQRPKASDAGTPASPTLPALHP